MRCLNEWGQLRQHTARMIARLVGVAIGKEGEIREEICAGFSVASMLYKDAIMTAAERRARDDTEAAARHMQVRKS